MDKITYKIEDCKPCSGVGQLNNYYRKDSGTCGNCDGHGRIIVQLTEKTIHEISYYRIGKGIV